jgi:hypothetical protein
MSKGASTAMYLTGQGCIPVVHANPAKLGGRLTLLTHESQDISWCPVA